jgi:hypothetical protein
VTSVTLGERVDHKLLPCKPGNLDPDDTKWKPPDRYTSDVPEEEEPRLELAF